MKAEITKDYELSGHKALITGVSGGIGAAIARRLSAAGAEIIVHYGSNRNPVEKLAAEIGNVKIERADLSNEGQVKQLIDTLRSEGDLPDLLVNNAALQTLGSVIDAGEEVWRDINNVNLGGVFALTKHVSNALIAVKKPGAIVNIASIEGLDPAEDHSHYAASKAGVIMYTKASALELGKHNIRVNAVSPGLISRPGIEDQWPDGVERWKERAPLGRLGTGHDVASAVHFLLSPAAQWISGVNLVVDGGMSAQNRW